MTTMTGPGTIDFQRRASWRIANITPARTSDGKMDRTSLLYQFHKRSDQSVRFDGQARHTTDLTHDDRDRHADEEADKDRARKKAGKGAKSQGAANQADDADAHRDQSGDRRTVGGRRVWEAGQHRTDNARENRHCWSVRPDDQPS